MFYAPGRKIPIDKVDITQRQGENPTATKTDLYMYCKMFL